MHSQVPALSLCLEQQPAASQGYVPCTMSMSHVAETGLLNHGTLGFYWLVELGVWSIFAFYSPAVCNDFLPVALLTKVSLSD